MVFKSLFKCCFVLFLLLSSYQCYAQNTNPIKEEKLNFTADDMVVMSYAQYKSYNIDNMAPVAAALKAYHATQNFRQSIADYKKDPDKYFRDRLAAIDHLIEVLPNKNQEPFSTLRRQLTNKRFYIQALPSMQNPFTTKPEALQKATKALHVIDKYWSELLDPLHRAGDAVSLREQLWEVSSLPNYFVHLETIENDPLLNKYAPYEHQVVYFTEDEEREPHRIQIQDGLLYHRGEFLDTSTYSTAQLGLGYAIFVLGLDNQFYINNHINSEIHHSSEFAGQEVLSVGEIKVEEGRISFINHKSGHYKPTVKDFLVTLAALQEQGVPLSDVTAHVFYVKHEYEANYNAEEFLASGGNCLPLKVIDTTTPLHLAVWRNQVEFAQDVLQENNIDAKDAKGNTALHLAVEIESLEWAKILLAHGANTELLSDSGYTPLHLALLKGNRQLVELLSPYSDSGQKSTQGATPLLLAIKTGNIELYHDLLQEGMSLTDVDDQGNNFLFYAVQSQDEDLLAELLDVPVSKSIGYSNYEGSSLLHAAAASGTAKMVKMLIERGLDPTEVNSAGHTLLHCAAKANNYAVVQFLLQNEMSWMAKVAGLQGATPLHLAAAALKLDEFQMLLTAGCNVDAVDQNGETALFYAVKGGNKKNILALAKAKANFRIYNHEGQAAVHVSALSAPLTIVQLLTQSEDIALLDADGNTPLHLALTNRNLACANELVGLVLPKLILHRNNSGLNVLETAVSHGHMDLAEKLERRLAPPAPKP